MLAIPSKELQLHIVGSKGSFKASRVQRLSINTDVPSTTVDELGNASHVGDVKDTPNVTLTFSAMDVGVKIFSALTGTDATAFPADGVDISKLGELDAIIYVKDPSASKYVKAAHAKRLQIRDFTFNYSVDGESTEDYTAAGSERRWFKNDVYVLTRTTGFTAAISPAPVALKNGNKLLSVIADGSYLTEVTGSVSAGEYSVGADNTVTFGTNPTTQVVYVYQVAANTNDWADVSDAQLPVAVKGRDVMLRIAANDIPRVQSVTINGTLNSQAVNELGSRHIIGYQKQIPEVTGTITVLDTDTELISLLQYGVTASGTEFAPGETCTQVDVALKVEVLDPCDAVAPFDVLKTVYIDKIGITGDAYTSNVNQNASQTFNFKSLLGHCVVYSGYKAIG